MSRGPAGWCVVLPTDQLPIPPGSASKERHHLLIRLLSFINWLREGGRRLRLWGGDFRLVVREHLWAGESSDKRSLLCDWGESSPRRGVRWPTATGGMGLARHGTRGRVRGKGQERCLRLRRAWGALVSVLCVTRACWGCFCFDHLDL